MLQNYKTCFHRLTCSLVEKAIKAIAKLVRLLVSLVRAGHYFLEDGENIILNTRCCGSILSEIPCRATT
ncbi:hypothetical protein [Calothrix sp. PCC 6303]|uniref:hypothetical protein n=1 Tax=Calothrix sp. PCC 6303 TaxID=1170562 RepID=UPI0002E2739D|nr:hypothetical protein [Calothrix sp. PCC 6303]